ncbi:MAG TPA: IPT/TIG domain-containing protein [Candidatus Cybelea sp.]|jgi:hypothetical protein|nr:IPT/TIG domain-containing protein [Candidatus Cybelea sp.]
MKALYETRGFIVAVEVFYLLVLFALALIYLTDLGSAYHLSLPTSLGPLPVGVPWFGALGAVIISLSGAFDHREDWDPSWNLWHLTRPLIGISLAIISWLTFQAGILAVGSTASAPAANSTSAASQVTAPTNLLFYLIAFVVGYRESVFRELIKRVADVILYPGDGAPAASPAPPVISALNPANGRTAGGDVVTITGSGLAGTTAVKFGVNRAANVQVKSDAQIAATTPPGTSGTVSLTVTTSAGSVTGGTFTYGA